MKISKSKSLYNFEGYQMGAIDTIRGGEMLTKPGKIRTSSSDNNCVYWDNKRGGSEGSTCCEFELVGPTNSML